jgi:hypothetical protein
MTTAVELPDGLEDIAGELEVAYRYLEDIVHVEMARYPAGSDDDSFDEWCEKTARLRYFVDRIGQHLGELRTMIDDDKEAGPLPG